MKICKRLFLRPLVAALCLAGIGSPGKVSAQWLGFLRLDTITGESADTNHAGWMDIISASVSNVTNSNAGSMPNVSGGPLCFEKNLDKASPLLKLYCAQGTVIPNGTLHLTRTNATLARFLQLKLTNIVVSSVTSVGNPASEARPWEEICLSAQVMSWNYAQFNPVSGLPQSYVESIWNFSTRIGSHNTNDPLFVVSGIRRNSGIELTWPATAGKTYRIYAVTRLNERFTPIAEVSAPVNGGGMITRSVPSEIPAMFFIVEQEP